MNTIKTKLFESTGKGENFGFTQEVRKITKLRKYTINLIKVRY